MTTLKTLVIGSTGHQHVTCVAWEDIASVNVKDFEIIVANVRSISDGFLQQCEYGFFDDIRSTLSSWLGTGGELIILGEKTRHIEKDLDTSFTNYSWLPIDLETIAEEGSTIEIKTTQYTKYIERFKATQQWKFYYSIPQPCLSTELKRVYGYPHETEYKAVLNPIAENRSQEVLSGIIELSVKREGAEELSLNPIVLLPCIDGLVEREAVNLVLEEKLSLPQGMLPPSWIETVPMPLVEDIQLTIDEKKNAIAVLEQEIIAIREEKQRLEAFKKLLYGSGKELEKLFANCLELLGGKIVPAKYSEEEFILEYKKQLYLVECKGVQKSISLTAARQLIDYMLEFEEREGYAAKGVLFGNAWNTLPPEKRDQSKTPVFPTNVVGRAKALDIALVSSVNFFQAFCDFLSGKVTGEEILDQIIGAGGVIEFKQTQPLVDAYQS